MTLDLDRLNQLAEAMSLPPSKGLKGLFYSDSGNGKSHLAMELADRITPDDKVWLLIDTSDNFSILDQINGGTGPRKTARSLPFTYLEDVETIAAAIAAGLPGWGDVATLVLDEGSIMAQQDVDRIYDVNHGEGKTLEDTPGWSEYRPSMVRFRRMMAKFMDIRGFNLLIVAHEKGPIEKLPKSHADFPIATYKAVKKSLTFVARVVADFKASPGSSEAVYSRSVQIHPTRAYDAKSRLGTDLVEMPTDWFIDACVAWLDNGKDDDSEEETEIPPNETVPVPSPATDDVPEPSDDDFDLDKFAL